MEHMKNVELDEIPMDRNKKITMISNLKELAVSKQINDDYKEALRWAIDELLDIIEPY
jgi:hypothetical protein